MGVGKSTIGRQLALETGRDFYDIDTLIEEEAGMAISDIFHQKGEKYFRKLESLILKEAVKGENKVLATGGGIVLNPDNVTLMKQNGTVFALTAKLDTLWERLKHSRGRPLLQSENPKARLRKLYEQRANLYKDADFTVHVDGKLPSAIVKEIVQLNNYIILSQKGSVINR